MFTAVHHDITSIDRPPPYPVQGSPSLSRARGGLEGYGKWSPIERPTGPRATLPPLASLAEAPAATDPAQRMYAAILEVGVAYLDHRAPFETSWTVPVGGGQPLRFSHATGNRLMVKRLLKRHPMDCRDIPIVRHVPSDEPAMSDEEIDAEIRRETTLRQQSEKRSLEAAKARAAEGRGRFERKALVGIDPDQVAEARRQRSLEWSKRRYAKRAAALQAEGVTEGGCCHGGNKPQVPLSASEKAERRADSAERMRRSRARKAARLAEAGPIDGMAPKVAPKRRRDPADKMAFDELWRLMCDAPAPEAEGAR